MNVKKIEGSFTPSADLKCATSKYGMVSSAFPDATKAGLKMLAQGGNAVDAACAAALALTVCEPQASGIFGQSMAILHINGKSIAIDGSSRIPSLAHLSRLESGERTTGHRATTVPSTIAVLTYLNFRYGVLDWKRLVEPSIPLAYDGYKITALQSRLQKREIENFNEVPNRLGAKYFLKGGKTEFDEGETFKQESLGRLLEKLAERGHKYFYQGEVARAVDEDMKANGGFLRYEDMAYIPWPVEREVVERRYRSLTVATVPPPAAGRTLLLLLSMLNHIPSKVLKAGSPESYHFLAEALRKAFLNRKERPFEANTYPQVDDRKLNSSKYARDLAKTIRDTIDPDLPIQEPHADDNDTTHLSVMDKDGNAVGITQSIERVYGSKAACPDLGFLYNNYMMAVETKDPAHPYYLRPNGVPWTTVSPAILFKRGVPWIVVGSPGSERIFSTVGQFISHICDRSLSISDAMDRPRVHCTIGGTVHMEYGRFDPEVGPYLEQSGYKIKKREDYSFYHGAIHAVLYSQDLKEFQGVAEVRRDGTAQGLE